MAPTMSVASAFPTRREAFGWAVVGAFVSLLLMLAIATKAADSARALAPDGAGMARIVAER